MVERPSSRLLTALVVVAASVVLGPGSPADAMVCNSSPGAGYTVEVCIDSPLDGATLAGDATVMASVAVTEGGRVAKLLFYLDSEYLLTDYEAPYEFTLPTATFADGPVTLEVEAVMRDSLVTDRTTVSMEFSNGLTAPPPAPTGFTPTAGTASGEEEPFIVAATGDGASGRSESDDVVRTIANIDPNLFLYLGDVYERGTYTEFKNWYGEGDRFGTFADITNPVLGNHERTGGEWPGYDFYWGTPSPDYSYDANGWHFIAMNLQQGGPSPAQTAWLTADLAANTAACTAAYFHYPVVSIGSRGDTPDLFSTWAQLVDAGVDLVLTGHEHNYQRWVPMDRNLAEDPEGMTQFVLGAGGHGVRGFVRDDSRLAAGADDTATAFGALRLELNRDGAAFSYDNTSDLVIDSGTLQCSGTPVDVTKPTVPGAPVAKATSGAQVDLAWSRSNDNVGVDNYAIYRDGALLGRVPGVELSYVDDAALPNTAYSYTIEAQDAAGNQSAQSAASVATTPPRPSALSFGAVADAYVDAGRAGTNFGSSRYLRVDGSPDRRGYLRFDVAGVSNEVASVTLRVYAHSRHSTGFQVEEVADNGWGELSVTYANAPEFGPVVGVSGPTARETYIDIDVSSYVTGNGSFNFALTPLNNTNLRMASRQSANPPQLLVMEEVPSSASFAAVADSYVDAGTEGTNFGSSRDLRVDGSPDRRGYLRFDVAGLSNEVASATLRIYAHSRHSTGFQVEEVADNGWGELSVTYANAPEFGPVVGVSGPSAGETYIDIDVSSYVTGNGSFSFAFTPLNNTRLRIASRESASPPTLLVALR